MRKIQLLLVILSGGLLLIGEGCSPVATQSVYYASTTPTDFSKFPMSAPLNGLVVTPIGSLTVNTTTTISASGGTAPYTYALISPSGGILNGNTFTAPGTAQLIQIDVSDSQGQTVRLSFPVTTAPTTPTQPLGPPVTYDVYSTPVCNSHYCTCGSVSQPGAPNQAAAQAICSAYGHTQLTAYTISDGPTGRYQCDPSTGQCYLNNNPANVVCVTVTCQ